MRDLGRARLARRLLLLMATAIIAASSALAQQALPVAPIPEPFAHFRLPDDWVERFWADPATKKLLQLEPKALAALVPEQAGFRFCRCPACPVDETADPLAWSASAPEKLTCRHCGASFPNDKIPAQKDKKVPEEVVEVRPGIFHKYPYHVPDAETELYPDERIYLAAKRDYEAREHLSKVALYLALKHRDEPAAKRDPAWSRAACVLILRFAQVYPNYALHYDQPHEPKYIQKAELKPPFRRAYRTGKWDYLASLDIPMNLVVAYAILRDTPAMAEAGKALNDPHPQKTIEQNLFRSSAEFVRLQVEEFSETSLTGYRGLLAVGRLLGDDGLYQDAQQRVAEFSRRGFYHDGLWKQGDRRAHQRVLSQLDRWLDPLSLAAKEASTHAFSMIPLAHSASAAFVKGGDVPEVVPVVWDVPVSKPEPRRPMLLGGAGVARLAVGEGAVALDLELRGQDGFGGPHFQRQSIRLSVAGRPVLDDLDDLPVTSGGWNLATASHNTVVVDGLNQRESFELARVPSEGGRFAYYAADADFQIVALDDPRAYPSTARRYRQTIVLSAGADSRYAVSVFEVEGGVQHDQIFHAPSGIKSLWLTTTPLQKQSGTLLPRGLTYLSAAKVEEGRWFVQSYAEFRDLATGVSSHPETATLSLAGRPALRLHLLGDAPRTLIQARTPDVPDAGDETRGTLIVRRRSVDGGTLKSVFINVFEPVINGSCLRSVGRVREVNGGVLLQLETGEGVEYLFVNHSPGTLVETRLPDGRAFSSDGLCVRVRGSDLVLAGGTVATVDNVTVRRNRPEGRIRESSRSLNGDSRGWFEVPGPIVNAEALAARTLLIRHGDGVSHGWTIDRIENVDEKTARIFVREEPGFLLDPRTKEARYYQFPGTRHPAPHTFAVADLVR